MSIVAAARAPGKKKKKRPLEPPKKTFHSAMEHGERERVSDYSVQIVGKKKKKAGRTKRKQNGSSLGEQSTASKKSKPEAADSRKKAARFSAYYGVKKEGKMAVRAVTIAKQWPPPPSPEEVKKRDKATTINKLLNDADIKRSDAIQNYVGSEVVDNLIVRGYLTFVERVADPDGKVSRMVRKNVITPKAFWGIRMPYHDIISSFEDKFTALRDARMKDDEKDIDDMVMWDEIQKYGIHMQSTRKVKNRKTGKNEETIVNVPLDSRKATQLLIEFDAKIRNESPTGARTSPPKASSVRTSSPKTATGKSRQTAEAAKRAVKKVKEAKEKAAKRFEELKLDPANHRYAICMVKDKFILPSKGKPGQRDKEAPTICGPAGSMQELVSRNDLNEWKIEQETMNMAEAVCNIVDKQCPDGVFRYMSLDDVPPGSDGTEIRNTVFVKGPMAEDELSRIRSQYVCPFPTIDDLTALARIHLRDKDELNAGNSVFRMHHGYIADMIELTARVQLQREGLCLQGSTVGPPPEEEEEAPLKKAKRPRKKKEPEPEPEPVVEESSETVYSEESSESEEPGLVEDSSDSEESTPRFVLPIPQRNKKPLPVPPLPPVLEENSRSLEKLWERNREKAKEKKEKKEKKKREEKKRKKPDPVEAPPSEEESEEEENQPTCDWLDRFTHVKTPLVAIFMKIRTWMLKTHGVAHYYENIDRVAPVMDALITYKPKKTEFTLDAYPEFGFKMMKAMIRKIEEGSKAKESVALILYFVYCLFLYTKCEQDLPWYIEPKKKKSKKEKGKKKKADQWGAFGFDFDQDGTGEKDTDEKDGSTAKIPSMYDDTLYADQNKWRCISSSENSKLRNGVIRVNDDRQVAVRLCAVAEAIVQNGNDNRPKGARKHLGIDLATTPKMFRKTRIYADPFTFWMWMAFMTEMFVGPLPKTRENDFKDIPEFDGSKLPLFESDPFPTK